MDFFTIIETIISEISNLVWPLFLPFILIVGAYTAISAIFKVKKIASEPSKLNAKKIIGPASISLGSMSGTGAGVGVLGSLSKLVGSGQYFLECMCLWALIGACIMIPVSYSEVLCSKIMGKKPHQYIGTLLNPSLAVIYMAAFTALYIFGFGGFQYSGIDTVVTIITETFVGIELSAIQRYLFIIVPIIIFVSAIVMTKKHHIFINSMTYLIFSAVILYFIFFITFISKTADYIPVFLGKIMQGMANPVPAMIGMPTGFILAIQRVCQTAETGLGSLAMAAQEEDTAPREAALIALIPCITTLIVSMIVTSYITSYGIEHGHFSLPGDALARLGGYYTTAVAVTGNLGLISLTIFTLFSAMTTLLGSYYFLSQLYNNSENKNIAIYIAIEIIAGTLAVFGFNIVFDAVDLLLFVVSGINIVALAVFVTKGYKKYIIKE